MTHLRSAVGSLPWLERGIYCPHTRRQSGPAAPVLRHGHPAIHADTVRHITRTPVPSSEIYRGGSGFNGGSGQLWLPQHSAEAGSTASPGPAGLTCRPGHSVARASSHGQPRIPSPGPGAGGRVSAPATPGREPLIQPLTLTPVQCLYLPMLPQPTVPTIMTHIVHPAPEVEPGHALPG